jgi:hypothetical protein
MRQEALDFGRDHRVSEADRRLLRILNDVVDAVGLTVAAGACGCRAQDLSDALSGRGNRYLRSSWIYGLLDIAATMPDMQASIARALVEPFGFKVAAAKPRDAKEELAELRATMERLAPAVLQLADAEMRRKP